MRKLLKFLFGSTINIVELEKGDTIIFETDENKDIEDVEWFVETLKKHFRANVIIARSINLKGVVRDKRNK